jgi:hypothetical protein
VLLKFKQKLKLPRLIHPKDKLFSLFFLSCLSCRSLAFTSSLHGSSSLPNANKANKLNQLNTNGESSKRKRSEKLMATTPQSEKQYLTSIIQ